MHSARLKHASLRLRIILAITLALVAVGSMGRVWADDGSADNAQHMVTIYDRGTEHTVITRADTVKSALEQAGISVEADDLVEPALDEKLVAENYNVNVYRARPVVVEDGQTRVKTITAAQSPVKIAKAADITLYPEDDTEISRVDDVVAEGGAGLKLTIDRATPFTFVLYGKRLDARAQAATVGEMLKEKDVKLGKDDQASVSLSTPLVAGMTVQVWRNGVQTMTQEEEIPMSVEQVQDQDRSRDFKEVRTPGKPGKKQVTYEIVMQNGVEVSRKVIQSVTTLEPVKQIEVIGVKSNHSASLNEWLSALRSCESGGAYDRNSGNGFYGAYQFMIGTWDRIAPKVGRADLVGVRPDLASPADQDMMIIANTKLSSGGLASQNPGCYNKLGLSQFPPN